MKKRWILTVCMTTLSWGLVAQAQEDVTAGPQVYSIRENDTMWDICQSVFDNPWFWPKLWSINQYIKNPNIIRPGQQIVFSPATDTTFPKMEVVDPGVAVNSPEPVEETDQQEMAMFEEVPSEAQPEKPLSKPVSMNDTNFIIEQAVTQRGDSLAVKLRNIMFISNRDLDTVGNVIHSGEPKMNLIFGDKVYLDFYRKNAVKVGDRFQVVEKVKMVFDPDHENRRIGWMIRKKAEITINYVSKEKSWRRRTVEGTITDGDDAVIRGDEFIPFETDIVSIVPHYTDREIFGKIVEADAEQFLIGNNDFVFLNLGKRDGMQPGLQLYVVRTGDGLDPDENNNLPDVPVGRIMVVDSKESTSTAYVMTLDRPLTIGDRVQTFVE